jgi:DHA1 family bicyclomycin/chloramphenicol resistance-like MFS transporter
VVRDLYEGAHAQKLMAQTAIAAGLGPVMAPIMGGWLHEWFGWVGPFAFLSVLGAALWIACHRFLPESLPVTRRQSFHPGRLVRSYKETLTHGKFVLLCLSMAFAGGGFLLYVATAPDMVLNILELKPTQFGWLFMPIVSGLILGSVMCERSAGRLSPQSALKLGFGIMFLGSIVTLCANVIPHHLPVVFLVLPLGIYTFGFALIAPVLTIQSIDLFPTRRGLASSMQGFSHVIVFALISDVAARLVYHSAVKHAVGLFVMMGVSVIAYWCSQVVNSDGTQSGTESPKTVLFKPIPNRE